MKNDVVKSLLAVFIVIAFFSGYWVGTNDSEFNLNIEMDNNTQNSLNKMADVVENVAHIDSYKFNETQCIWNSYALEYWCFT